MNISLFFMPILYAEPENEHEHDRGNEGERQRRVRHYPQPFGEAVEVFREYLSAYAQEERDAYNVSHPGVEVPRRHYLNAARDHERRAYHERRADYGKGEHQEECGYLREEREYDEEDACGNSHVAARRARRLRDAHYAGSGVHSRRAHKPAQHTSDVNHTEQDGCGKYEQRRRNHRQAEGGGAENPSQAHVGNIRHSA